MAGYTIEDAPAKKFTITDAPTTEKNQIEQGEAVQYPVKGSLWQKAKLIPAAIAPDENTRPLDVLGRAASGAWSGLKAMNPFAGATDTSPEHLKQLRDEALSPWKVLGPGGEMLHSVAQGYQQARGEGGGVIPSVGAGLAGAFGLDTEGIKQRAAQGDVAGVIGEGIPAIAATLIGGEHERIPSVSDVKGGVAKVFRTPEGELRPAVEKGARVAGAAAGHVLGPVGSIAGYEAGPGIVNKLIPERIPAVEKAFVPQGPKIPAVSTAPYKLTMPTVEPEAAIQQEFTFPKAEGVAPAPAQAAAAGGMQAVAAPGHVGPPLQRLGELIEQAAGTPPETPGLIPNVPLRSQLPQPVGAASAGFTPATEPMQNLGGKVTFRREPIIKTVPGLEEGPLRAVAPEKMPAVFGNEVERAFGGEPDEAAQYKQRTQQKYPDREHRQLVHSEGEDLADAVGSNRELLTKLHDLKNPDVRQAAINAGEDMVREDGSPIMVNSRAADVRGETALSRMLKFNKLIDQGFDPQTIANEKMPGDIPRQSMFKWLLKRGVKPEDMLDLARQEMEPAIAGGKPGPTRAEGRGRTRREGAAD